MCIFNNTSDVISQSLYLHKNGNQDDDASSDVYTKDKTVKFLEKRHYHSPLSSFNYLFCTLVSKFKS